MTLQKAQEYYYKKYLEWQSSYPSGYQNYIRNKKNNLSEEFKSDIGNINHDFRDVCNFLKEYEIKQQSTVINEAVAILKDIENPDNDVLQIIIAASLKVCYPNSAQINDVIKNILVTVSIGGFILFITYLLSKDKK